MTILLVVAAAYLWAGFWIWLAWWVEGTASDFRPPWWAILLIGPAMIAWLAAGDALDRITPPRHAGEENTDG